MDGYKAYKFYLAIKLHFNSEKFDVFFNRGALKYSREKFNSRNDRLIFEKLAKRFSSEKDYIQYIASNFMYGNPDVAYSGTEGDDNYIEYLRRKESMTKIFKGDLDTIITYHEKYPTESAINCTNNTLPYIISLYLSNQITLETVRILDDRLSIIHHLKMENQTLYKMFEDLLLIVDKAKGFVKYSSEKTNPHIENLITELKLNYEPNTQEIES
jgi:hypothetical protein